MGQVATAEKPIVLSCAGLLLHECERAFLMANVNSRWSMNGRKFEKSFEDVKKVLKFLKLWNSVELCRIDYLVNKMWDFLKVNGNGNFQSECREVSSDSLTSDRHA